MEPDIQPRPRRWRPPPSRVASRHAADGTKLLAAGKLRMRSISTADAERLASGFERLSSRSRRQRFFHVVNALSRDDLAALVNVDGRRHVAVGIFERDSKGEDGDAIAVARYYLLDDEPQVADVAVAVVDEYQRQGLGTRLLQTLLTTAIANGVTRLKFEVLSDNRAVRKLMDRAPSMYWLHHENGVLFAEVGLVQPSRDRRRRTSRRLLIMIAKGAFTAAKRFRGRCRGRWH